MTRRISSVPHAEGLHGNETGVDDLSMFSAETETEEGLEIKGAGLQQQEAELPLEREEFLMSISTRLQSAVEKLLITITDTSTQVRQAQGDKINLSTSKRSKSSETHTSLGV